MALLGSLTQMGDDGQGSTPSKLANQEAKIKDQGIKEKKDSEKARGLAKRNNRVRTITPQIM